MSLLRHHSFYRNSTVIEATDHAKALIVAQESFNTQVNSLNDGEILLYRYKIDSEEQGTVYTIVGVTHVVDNTKSYTIIGNTPWTEASLTEKLQALYGTATIATNSDGVVTLNTSVKQENGKIATDGANTIQLAKVSTTGKAEDVSITDTNNAINANTVEGALTEIAEEINAMDLDASSIVELSGTTLTHKKIIQTDGKVTLDTAADLLKFKSAPSNDNPVVTQKDISGIAGSMHYKGTISINTDGSITYPENVDGEHLTIGDVFVVATGGAYEESDGKGWKVETGDMFVWNGTKFDIINGENQVENKNVVIVAGNANSVTIATVDGTDITAGVKVTAGKATIATKTSDGIVTLKAGITQDGTSGSVKNKEGNADITLHKVATTGSASDVIVTNTGNQFGEAVTNVQGALEAINSKYSTLKNYSKINLDQTTSIEPVNASSELTLKGDTWINLSKGENSELEIKHKTRIVDENNNFIVTGESKSFNSEDVNNENNTTVITVPSIEFDNAGHATKYTNKYYTLKLPNSIASAIQTIKGNIQTSDQRDNLNNLKFVNVNANTVGTEVLLETSLKTLALERATGIVAYRYRGVLNGDINLSEGDFNDEPVIIIRGSKNIYVNLTEGDRKALAELAVQIRDKKIRVVNENFDKSTDDNPTTVEKIEYCVIPNFNIFNNSKEKLRALLNPEELYVLAYHEKLNSNIDDGLATAINTKNYIDSHHPKVVAGTNTTVTTSTTNGVTTYTVNATQAPQKTSSVVAGEGISVSSDTANNTTKYTVSLAKHTTTATTNVSDNYTDETNTHTRISDITVDNYGRVTKYTKQTVTEDFDCGTF